MTSEPNGRAGNQEPPDSQDDSLLEKATGGIVQFLVNPAGLAISSILAIPEIVKESKKSSELSKIKQTSSDLISSDDYRVIAENANEVDERNKILQKKLIDKLGPEEYERRRREITG